MSDKQLDAYCEEWLYWCYTRKYYLQPGAQNILARMQPSKVKEPPNARNSAEMQYFNMAIWAMADMKEHASGWACFRVCYGNHDALLKQKIAELKISRGTYYNRTRAFARQALSLARSLRTATECMKNQPE
ncbi:hypothetical protein ACIPEN_22330 [Herbaspirillum chlorophenolicum]|uniref:Phage antitermination protein Q n=1 Tax=Herbaspirillum chlorophenolicum TaxID=211589 RepID=A0ABW8F5L5_9BURK